LAAAFRQQECASAKYLSAHCGFFGSGAGKCAVDERQHSRWRAPDGGPGRGGRALDQCKDVPSSPPESRDGTNRIPQAPNKAQVITFSREAGSARQRATRSARNTSVKHADNEPTRGSQFNAGG